MNNLFGRCQEINLGLKLNNGKTEDNRPERNAGSNQAAQEDLFDIEKASEKLDYIMESIQDLRQIVKKKK